jgi:hypothetical protein
MAVLLVIVPLVAVHGQHAAGAEDAEILEQRVKELEKAVTELQDANAVLMENLMNCVEENKEPTHGPGQEAAKPQVPTETDPRLVDRLEKLLQTDEDLDFMLKLNPLELELLLELVQKRLAST